MRCGYFSKLSCLLYDTMARTTANNVFAFAQNLIFSRISVGGGGGSAGNGNDVRPIRSRRVRRFFFLLFFRFLVSIRQLTTTMLAAAESRCVTNTCLRFSSLSHDAKPYTNSAHQQIGTCSWMTMSCRIGDCIVQYICAFNYRLR